MIRNLFFLWLGGMMSAAFALLANPHMIGFPGLMACIFWPITFPYGAFKEQKGR